MKKSYRTMILFFASAFLFGCVNCYTRWPTTNPRIESVYQSTRVAFALSYVAAFPQTMSDGHADKFMWENLLSVPFLGVPLLIDTAGEAVVDTVCLPFDYYARERSAKE